MRRVVSIEGVPSAKKLGCLLIVLVVFGAPASAAAASCPRTSVASVEHEVMCLQCGTPLAVSEDAPAARQERDFIAGLVAQCRSKSEIKSALVAQYGDRVLALPRARGFGLAAYLVPALGVAAATALAAWLALRWRRNRRVPVAAGSQAPTPDPRDLARLEADIRRYE